MTKKNKWVRNRNLWTPMTLMHPLVAPMFVMRDDDKTIGRKTITNNCPYYIISRYFSNLIRHFISPTNVEISCNSHTFDDFRILVYFISRCYRITVIFVSGIGTYTQSLGWCRLGLVRSSRRRKLSPSVPIFKLLFCQSQPYRRSRDGSY